MKTSDFFYDLPEELIAQTPLEKRDTSRLLTLDRFTGEIAHKHFYDILDYLQPGDCLVMNDSRVCPPVCWVAVPPAAPWRCCCCVTLATSAGNAFVSPVRRCGKATP